MMDKKALITTVLFAVFFGGIFAYLNIGKLEDAEIPIKTAVVVTVYPGATAHEVELEVTDVLEKAIQKLENIKDITSVSEPGLSKITININSEVKTHALPQLWDHLRRKVNDAKSKLPKGAYEPIVNDDFADVYGMLYAVTAEGYSDKELSDYTEFIERELLSIKGIRRSQIFGTQQEAIDVSFSSEKLANLNINPMYIAMAMQNQSQIVNPGSIIFGQESIRVGVGSKINSMKEIEDLLIQVPKGGNFRLGDIAKVQRSTMFPKRQALYFNGKKALSLGLSNESGINVVKLGEELVQRLEEIKEKLPAGIDIHNIYSQPERVEAAVSNFMWNLVMSVGVVILVLLFSMGYRSGLLISSGLIFTILGTLIVMLAIGMPLHRISLAAIILAMGMLVDNAIVVADGILVDLKKGINRKDAFLGSAKRTGIPLLGATLVAILAFMPLALAPNAAGEFLSSLFTVLVISLLLSWVFAMIQTPFMAKYFYRKERPKGEHQETYNQGIYKYFGKGLRWALAHKIPFLLGSIVTLLISLYAFKFVNIDFMPRSDYNQFVIEYNLPQGADIDAVENDIKNIQEHILKIEGIQSVTSAIGSPPARYALMRYMPQGGQNYGELIVETKTTERVEEIIPDLREYLAKNYPNALSRIHRFGASFSDFEVEVEFSGPDPSVLRQLAEEAKRIFRNEPMIIDVTDNWKDATKKLSPNYSVQDAQRLGLSRNDLANSILVATNGMPIGSYYEGTEQIPIILKTDTEIADNMESLLSIPVWGQQSTRSIPLNQIVNKIELKWEDESVHRYNGKRALKVQGDVMDGYTATQVQVKIEDQVNAIKLPKGYSIRWDGTYAKSNEANDALFKYLPLAIGLMLIIIIAIFNNLKQTLIIFIVVPFALLGISFGFNVTGANFGFVAIIGALGLIGMMIKNSIVLLDEINLGLKAGKTVLNATIDSALSRMRPVMMASLTTILGMMPLITDSMFKGMAITIMFGLLIGSVVTLMVVPVLYVTFFKVDVSKLKNRKK